jgi:transcriptional regulator with XRE-family HTH domain
MASKTASKMNDYEELIKWLNNELNNRNWSLSELGRRAGVSTASISWVLSNKTKPTERFCIKIAKALGVNPDMVLKLAEYDTVTVEAEDSSLAYDQLINEAKFLEGKDLDEVLSFTRWKRATSHGDKVWQEDRLRELE